MNSSMDMIEDIYQNTWMYPRTNLRTNLKDKYEVEYDDESCHSFRLGEVMDGKAYSRYYEIQ